MRTGILLFVTAILAACGGHDDASTPSATAPASNPTTATAVITASGGTVSMDGVASVTFPPGAFSSATTVTVEKVTDLSFASDFTNGAAIFGELNNEDFAVKVDVATVQMSDVQTTASLIVSDELSGLAQQGATLAAFSRGLDESDVDDDAESHDVYDLVNGQFNSSSKTLTIDVSTIAFRPELAADGHMAALIRVAALPIDSASPTPNAAQMNAVVKASAKPLLCPGDASFGAPMVYGWRQAANGDPTAYYDSIPGIVGPFAEGRKGRQGHQGMDFFAEEGTPVLAVADGYFETVKDQNYDCPGTKENPTSAPREKAKANQKRFPEFTLVLALTDASGHVTDHVWYRHLSANSVHSGTQQEDTFKTCWRDSGSRKYKVAKGDPIALSGSTGTDSKGNQVPPHLHFEWVPVGGSVSNPLCRLATFFAGAIDRTDPKTAEMADKLYVQPAPGTAFNDNRLAETIWVRRNKGQSSSNQVCLVNGGPSQCDYAGRGFFMYALDNPSLDPISNPNAASTSVTGSTTTWPSDSSGTMAVQRFSSSDTTLVNMVGTLVAPSQRQNITPPPLTNYVSNAVTFANPLTCGATATFSYTVALWADRNRTQVVTFNPYRATVTFVPFFPYPGAPPTCAPQVTPIS
ncbi:M23 family metallopeptidase [Burkholderia sp. JPY481]